MTASDGNRACEDAAAYYHDFLLDPGDPSLPRSVTDHIERCEHCRGQIDCLRELLDQAEGQGEASGLEADKALVAELQRHFEHIGEQVGCEQARPLLPTLLLPTLRVRVPTPVTVHVDHCAACIHDLAAIRRLALNDTQLIRLSRLYEDCAAGDFRTCEESWPSIAALAELSLEGLDAEVLRHLCVCPTCRDMVYARRQERIDRQRRDGSGAGAGCGRDVSMAELFDYAVPYKGGGIDCAPAVHPGGGIVAHLRSCPQCLEKLQTLHRAIYGVVERPDSKVVTVYTAEPTGEERLAPDVGLYAGQPIGVEVGGLKSDPVEGAVRLTSGVRAFLRRASSNPALRPVLKTAFLTAAMITLVAVFWPSVRPASGLNLGQVSDMLAGEKAIYVKTTHMGLDTLASGMRVSPESLGALPTEPTTEVWASADTIIWKGPQTYVVFDLVGRRKLDLRANGGRAGWVKADNQEIERFRTAVYYLGLRNVPLERVVEPEVLAHHGSDEVYDAVWPEMKGSGDSVLHWCRLTLDPSTRRPQKSELFFRKGTEGLFESDEVTVFTYPEPHEIAERASILSAGH